MTTAYFLNLAGAPLSDTERGNVPHPNAELITHVTLKSMQAGAVLGAGIIGPGVSVARGKPGLQGASSRRRSGMAKSGLAIGLLVGPGVGSSQVWPT